MKGFILLLLSMATLYVAGIYRSGTVMFLAIVEFLLWVCMVVLAGIFSGKLKVVSWGNEGRCVRGERVRIPLIVENKGGLPIWYFRASILHHGNAPVKKHATKLVYDGQVKAHGRERCLFEISLEHCGLECFTLEKIFVWDNLKLFRKKLKAVKLLESKFLENKFLESELLENKSFEKVVPVFPREYVMNIEAAEGESLLTIGNDSTPIPMVGEDVQEVLQYNEYAPGDSFKNIHWKLSARSDEIWVKKFSRADAHRVSLFANLLEDEGMEDREKDAFYEVLQALILGLMPGFGNVYLYWYDPKPGEIQCRRISDSSDKDAAFVALYQAGWTKRGQIDERAFAHEKSTRLGEQLIELDSGLGLFYGGRLIKRFTVWDYERELRVERVVLP